MTEIRRRTALLFEILLAAALLFAAAACSSGPETKPTDGSPEAARQPAKVFAAYEHLERRARWLPADTQLVAVGDASYLWEFFAELVPPADGQASDKSVRAELLRQKLSKVWSDRVQIDLTAADSVVMGAGEERMALILDGKFSAPPAAERLQVNGYEVYRLQKPFEGAFQNEVLQMMASQVDLYMVMLEEPAGVAIFIDEGAVDRATTRVKAGLGSLAKTERLAEFKSLFALTKQARLVVAGAGAPPPEEAAQLDEQWAEPSSVESADQAVFAMGPNLQTSFRGSEQALDDIEAEIQDDIEAFRRNLEAMQTSYGAQSLLQGSASAVIAYLGESYVNALQKKRTDSTLTYRMPLPQSRSSAVLAGLLGLGLTDWLQMRGAALLRPRSPDEADKSAREVHEK